MMQINLVWKILKKQSNDLVGSTMGYESNKAFDGLFNDMRLQDARLGETVADRTDMIGRVMVKVSDIDFDLQDSQFDVLGTAYMILIGLFASDEEAAQYSSQVDLGVVAKNLPQGTWSR